MRTRDIAELALLQTFRPRDPTVIEPRIEINQQPHDAADAARLFGQLKDAAEAKVVETIRVGNTDFECVVGAHVSNIDNCMIWRAVFRVGNVNMQVEHPIQLRSVQTSPWDVREAAFEGLKAKIAEKLAVEILGPAFSTVLRAAR